MSEPRSNATENIAALHLACVSGNWDRANTLVQSGFDVNGRLDEGGPTPLHWASKGGPVKMVDALLRAGADFDAEDQSGWTPLHFASYGHLELVNALIRAGADVNKRDRGGQTPLHVASASGFVETVLALLQHGAEVNVADSCGDTALHYASTCGRDQVVEVLLLHGADVRFKSTASKETALDQAADDCVTDAFERHFIKMNVFSKLHGVEEVPDNGIPSSWTAERRREYREQCLEEISSLKEEIGSTHFTYLDMLMKNSFALRDLAVEEILARDDHQARFPIYGRLIDLFHHNERRWRLLERSSDVLKRIGHFEDLPIELVLQICRFLNAFDLETVTRSELER